MILMTILIAFLSPFTAFSVQADTLPRIKTFSYKFAENIDRSKSLYLECEATGSPPPNITFQLNGNELRQPVRQLTPNKRRYGVTIRNVSFERGDEGKYRCVATNDVGLIFEEEKIMIEVMGAFLQTPNDSVTSKTWKKVTLGRPYTLFCPRYSHTQPKTVTWGSEPTLNAGISKTLQEDNERMVLPDGSLYFPHVTVALMKRMTNDFKWGIQCILESSVTRGAEQSHEKIYSNPFLFHYNAEKAHTNDIQPHIEGSTRLPLEMFLAEGQSKTMVCAAGGNPLPSVTWYHEGVQVTNTDTRFEFNPYQPHKLTISRMRADMQGDYACVYKNRAGVAKTKGNLVLAAAPMLVKSIKDQSPEHSSEFQLNCKAIGTEPITYEWYRNGRRLTTHQSWNSTTTIDDGSLHIERLNYHHRGSYQCIARNDFGYKYSVANIDVIKPKPIVKRGEERQGPVTRQPGISKSGSETSNGLSYTMIIVISSVGSVILLVILVGAWMVCRSRNEQEGNRNTYSTRRSGELGSLRTRYSPTTYDHTKVGTAYKHEYDDCPMPPPPPGFLTRQFSSYSDEENEDSGVDSSADGVLLREHIDFELAKRSPKKIGDRPSPKPSPPERSDSLSTASSPSSSMRRKPQRRHDTGLSIENSFNEAIRLGREQLKTNDQVVISNPENSPVLEHDDESKAESNGAESPIQNSNGTDTPMVRDSSSSYGRSHDSFKAKTSKARQDWA